MTNKTFMEYIKWFNIAAIGGILTIGSFFLAYSLGWNLYGSLFLAGAINAVFNQGGYPK